MKVTLYGTRGSLATPGPEIPGPPGSNDGTAIQTMPPTSAPRTEPPRAQRAPSWATTRSSLPLARNETVAVLDPLKLIIDNYPEGEGEEFTVANHPKDESQGNRQVPFSRELWIEADDFQLFRIRETGRKEVQR